MKLELLAGLLNRVHGKSCEPERVKAYSSIFSLMGAFFVLTLSLFMVT